MLMESPPSETFELYQESSLHHYRTEIPNIIFDMNLEPAEFKTYCVLKMTAGDGGSCFKSITTLCEQIGIGETKLRECKKALVQKGLISVQSRRYSDKGSYPDLITIKDMWHMNMKVMGEKFMNRGAPSDFEGGGVRHAREGGSPREAKQEHIQQEKKQQQAKPSAAASSEEKPKAKIHPKLQNLDIPDDQKVVISKKYDEKTISDAVDWATDPDNPPEKSLAASIKFACNNKLSIEQNKKQKLSPYEIISKSFKHGNFYNDAECHLKPDGVAFMRGMKHEGMKFNKFFSWEKFRGICKSFGIKYCNDSVNT